LLYRSFFFQDVDKIVNLPMDEFSSYAASHNFSEEQMNVLRDAINHHIKHC
jgi:hypothetical protein